MAGWHARLNLYTPYWDPECGVWADVMAAGGAAEFNGWKGMGQARGELAAVKEIPLPDWFGQYPAAVRGARRRAVTRPRTTGSSSRSAAARCFAGFDLASGREVSCGWGTSKCAGLWRAK